MPGPVRRLASTTPDVRAAAARRAVRVSTAAAAGFYSCRYGLNQPVTAIYALFGALALGVISQICGSGRQRAATTAAALPVGWLLVAIGTAAAAHTWTAALGMLLVGFPLTLASIAGPRPASTAPGLQLLYILPSFPPYAPQQLAARLTGVTIGVLALAAVELLLPVPPGPSYRTLLADAVTDAGRLATRLRRPAELDETDRAAVDPADERLRPSHLPPAERPASPSRTDRALAQAGAAVRVLLGQLHALARIPEAPADDPPSAAMLARIAEACACTAAALRGGPAPPATAMDEALRAFQAERIERAQAGSPDRATVPALRRQARVLAAAEPALTLKSAVRVAVDGRRAWPLHPVALFWYVRARTPTLWWYRIRDHLTPHSVYFQNAVRTTVGLAAARLAAGVLDLQHGFWVLLAVLTLTRTTALNTWRSVRQALLGSLVGALASAALLLIAGQHAEAYAVALVPLMLVAFTLGPLLGVAWGQALFTLVVATAFAQLAPTTWQLARTRLLDVATGSVIGLTCGLLAWPRGARGELRRNTAALVRAGKPVIEQTAAALLGPTPAPEPSAIRPARRALRLAESSYAQYQGELATPRASPIDWQAALIAASRILQGADELLDGHCDSPRPRDPAGFARARAAAAAVAAGCDRLADLLADGRDGAAPVPRVRVVPSDDPSPADAPALPLLVDLERWLDTVATLLDRVLPEPAATGADGGPPVARLP
ncbi:FUSC family protein [Kitasatospora sp. NPDC052896]|uniref:FUSC family protein n=1 Tax=Kitasatospora sp. NPDC052896 TaxID=3364061 RepID=UPI0037C835AC